jgi:hypothetical protein
MNAKAHTKRAAPSAPPPPAPLAGAGESSSYLVKSVKLVPVPEKDLSGVYRVIHGNHLLPVPREQRLHPDGTENPHAPMTVSAGIHVVGRTAKGDPIYKGDEVWLSHADAYRLLAMEWPDGEERHMHALVEALDAKPSRVGKVFTPPKITKSWSAPTAAAAT